MTTQSPPSKDTPNDTAHTAIQPDATQLEKQLELAEDLVAGYRASARLHSLRSDGICWELNSERHYRRLERSSLSWKITKPLRLVRSLAAGRLPSGRPLKEVAQRIREITSDEGWKGIWERCHARLPERPHISFLQKQSVRTLSKTSAQKTQRQAEDIFQAPLGNNSLTDLQPLFLIIAELSIPQCAKYRVWQKQEALESLGWRVVVVDWHDLSLALTMLQMCTRVVFYRVPGNKDGLSLIEEAHRLSLNPWWEVDDLIFDPVSYEKNTNLKSLSNAERQNVLKGVKYYRKALLSCKRAIASTPGLADAMRAAGVADVSVIENALDKETLETADLLLFSSNHAHKKNQTDIIVFYGSGTKTHDMDFLACSEGLFLAMQENPRIKLKIVGELTLPEAFSELEERVEKLPGRTYTAYLQLLANADISIAPLEDSIFNDCKSNIKFLEAAILGIPSVCSPAQAFSGIIQNGKNGFLSSKSEEWKTAFLSLAENADLRQKIGSQARTDVTSSYSLSAIAQTAVLNTFGRPAVHSVHHKPRLMVVNVFFEPRSFGGATLVAEEMAEAMQQRGYDVAVMTSRPSLNDRFDSALRYTVKDMQALAVLTPNDPISGLDNPQLGEIFREWVRAWQPDVVHFHATQGLGTSLIRVCQELALPYIITLHDAWWLCERQFMVQGNGQYCAQKTIDLRVCEMCVPSARHLTERRILMNECLKHAAFLLSPSQSHLELYSANGFAGKNLIVNRNGFVWPKHPHLKRQSTMPLRFGYVGGNEAVKGFPLIRKAFEKIDRSDWELVIVDNTLKLGFKSIDTSLWKVSGTIKVIPSYTSDGIDDFFDQFDVLLFPSQWQESFGLTVREALARDVWVITTAPGGQSEDVTDGINGTLIPISAQEKDLRLAIEALLEKTGFFNTYENPLKHSLSTYKTQADQLFALYEQARLESASKLDIVAEV